MKKTVIYKEKPSSNSSDEYYDEVVETTWVVKLGDKNITDKDLLDYLNNQTKDEDLFERKNEGTNSGKSPIETETSWFTMGRKANLTQREIMKFFDDQLDLDDLLKTVLPTGIEKPPPREVISRKVWISDGLDKEIKRWNIDQLVQDTFKNILKEKPNNKDINNNNNNNSNNNNINIINSNNITQKDVEYEYY
uniref:GYF_2 domain-containing protein n=1 Tax=Schistosoma mansoni TaxID=6183 RepID=A0A5K4FE15_SCHMA